MIKKITLIILFSSIFNFAQTAGNSGLSFLKIGVSARSIALSDIGLLNSDPASVFYNPASLNIETQTSIMFTHQAWIQDLRSEIVNANFSMLGLPFAVGINTTKISGFEVRTIPTETPEATFNANFFYGSLSTGFNLIENLGFGVTIKYLYESLFSDDASGTGYDLGLVYSNLIDNLNVGVSLRNLGSMQKLREEKTKLPADLIVNSTYLLNLEKSNFDFLPVIGIQKYLEQDELHFHVGTETTYDKQFSLRVGYTTGYDSKGLSAGAGFYWKGLNFDYAFTPFNYGIGNANTITLAYTF